MKRDKEATLKSIIAKALTTRPTYVEIVSVTDEAMGIRSVRLTHRGFPYVASLQNDRVLQIARRVT